MNEVNTFYNTLRSLSGIMDHLRVKQRYNVKHHYINPLLESGFLEMTISEKSLTTVIRSTEEYRLSHCNLVTSK